MEPAEGKEPRAFRKGGSAGATWKGVIREWVLYSNMELVKVGCDASSRDCLVVRVILDR